MRAIVLVHERLAIVDPESGSQPIRSADGELALAVDGEIYNHLELRRELTEPYEFLTASGGEVICALYRQDDPHSFLNRLNGTFAFALWDRKHSRALIARDPIGVCPLYWGHDRDGLLWIASETKSLADLCEDVAPFPPGYYYSTECGLLVRYYGSATAGSAGLPTNRIAVHCQSGAFPTDGMRFHARQPR